MWEGCKRHLEMSILILSNFEPEIFDTKGLFIDHQDLISKSYIFIIFNFVIQYLYSDLWVIIKPCQQYLYCIVFLFFKKYVWYSYMFFKHKKYCSLSQITVVVLLETFMWLPSCDPLWWRSKKYMYGLVSSCIIYFYRILRKWQVGLKISRLIQI